MRLKKFICIFVMGIIIINQLYASAQNEEKQIMQSSIEDYCFANSEELVSYKIPDSVIRIGYGAFLNCTNLSSIFISNSVEEIENIAFCDCVSLTEVIIPDSVKYIGEHAFAGCTSLRSVVLPDSIEYVAENAFEKCDSLINFSVPDSAIRELVIEEGLIKKTVDDIKKMYGDYDYKYHYIVSSGYNFFSEIEPDYSKYFSKDEMNNGIDVYMFIWKRKFRNTYVWATKEDENYIIFSSVDYDSKYVKF